MAAPENSSGGALTNIQFECSHCGRSLVAEWKFAGGQTTCPICGNQSQVPDFRNQSPNSIKRFQNNDVGERGVERLVRKERRAMLKTNFKSEKIQSDVPLPESGNGLQIAKLDVLENRFQRTSPPLPSLSGFNRAYGLIAIAAVVWLVSALLNCHWELRFQVGAWGVFGGHDLFGVRVSPIFLPPKINGCSATVMFGALFGKVALIGLLGAGVILATQLRALPFKACEAVGWAAAGLGVLSWLAWL
jgi:hypothetical protein